LRFGLNQFSHQAWNCLLLCLVCLVFAPKTITAAETERLPGIVDRPARSEIEPEEIRDRETADVPIPAAPQGEQVADPNKILIDNLSEVTFTGFGVLDEATLQQAVAPFIGQPLSAAGLAELKYALTRLYYDQGYVLVKVVTPPQDVTDGVLDVTIYEAQIGAIDIIDNDAISPFLVKQMTRRLETGEVFREGPVESMVNDVNDLGGVSATVNLRPGTTVGTTDMALQVEPADDDTQRFTIDNYASELTGEYVAMAQLQKSNLLGWGETLRFIGRKAVTDDLWSVVFGATIPTGFRNVYADIDISRSENEIGDRLANLDASGQSTAISLGLSSAIINRRSEKLNVRGGFLARRGESFLADVTESRDDIRQFFLEGNYLWNWPNTVGYVSLRLTQGVDIFGASDEGDPLTTRLGGDPQATKIQPLLYIGHRLSENGLLKAIFVGQFGSDKMLAGDLFSIGGYGTVRGFEPGQESGEEGVFTNIEYQHRIYQHDIWTLHAGPFLDAGWIDSGFNNTILDDTLVAAGLGMEVSTTPSLWRYGDSTLRFDWAHRLGDYESTIGSDNNFYFRFTQTF